MILSADESARLRVIGLEVKSVRHVLVAGADELAVATENLGDGPGRTASRFTIERESTRATLHGEAWPDDDLLYLRADVSAVDNATWWEAARFGLEADDTLTVKLQLPQLQRALACHLSSEWWTVPAYVSATQDIPERTQFLLWQDRDGRYGALVPLVGEESTAFVRGDSDHVSITAACGQDRRLRATMPLFVAASGWQPHEVVARAYRQALELLGRPGRLRREKAFPAAFEWLGWCTWDAFYRDVTADGILAQLAHFRSLGLPVGFLLIDDGWYPMRNNQLVDVRVDDTRFPQGLASVVETARRDHGVQAVGLWHALTGYWCGIAADHTLPEAFRPHLQDIGGEYGPSARLESAFCFFELWHRALARDGIDFVKVDGQGALHRYSRNHMPIGEGARNVQKALQASVGANFNGQMLNCMSMRHELMWNWSMSNLTRSSNDYMIHGVESEPGQHAQVNVANAVYMGQMSWCDFDMFRTDQENAEFHAALRALSGGPVYISDPPGKTRPEVLWPLVTRTGRVLRCDGVALPTEDCLLVDRAAAGLPLKIINRAGEAALLGVFELTGRDEPVPGSFCPGDVHDFAGDDFAVWGFHLRRGRRLARQQAWEVQLGPREAQVFVISPIRDGFAPVGIVDKIVAPKTMSFWRHRGDEIRVLLIEAGRFVAYCERRPRQVLLDGEGLSFAHADGWLEAVIPTGAEPPEQDTFQLVIAF